MKKTLKLFIAAIVVMSSLATSAFAETRHRAETIAHRDSARHGRSTSVRGRIVDIDRERNGFVIRLDSGEVLFATRQDDVDARTSRRVRVRDLERGDVIRASGNLGARGVIHVYDIDLVRDRDGDIQRNGANRAHVSGIVDSVDARRGIVWLRDSRSGSAIAVYVSRDRADLYRLRHGDRLTARGAWRGNGTFDAVSVDAHYDRW